MTDVATSREQELAVLDSWKPRPQFRDNPVFRDLVDNEFLDPDRQTELQLGKLRRMLQYAGHKVPFYRDSFASTAFDPARFDSLEALTALPELSRYDAVHRFDALQAERSSEWRKSTRLVTTSGSTSLPVKVRLSKAPVTWFTTLVVRHARWFRYDLQKRFARIRPASGIWRRPDGGLNPDGETITSPRWKYVGRFFHTGDEVQFNISNSREAMLAWLAHYRPAHLMTYPTLMEELALANEGREIPGLESLTAISSSLTTAMRARIDQSFGVPIHQTYGLNEVGLVAGRCAAGRYHVHAESVLVEIVDDGGQPVEPGCSGRLLVTSLVNTAMPIIRYDSGDIATAADGPCLCGRTTPSIRNILGRHIQFAGTPKETRPRLNRLWSVMSAMPNELFTNIRQYQIRQSLERDFEIRVVAVGARHPGFEATLQEKWTALNAELGAERKLSIVEVDAIEPTPSGKHMDFVSDFQDLDADYT